MNNVILIDDHDRTTLYHEIIMEDVGFNMDFVKSFVGVDEVMAYLIKLNDSENQKEWPEVLIIDLNMPIKSAYDFLDEYQAIAWKFELPKIYVVSSYISSSDSVRLSDINIVQEYRTKILEEDFFLKIKAAG